MFDSLKKRLKEAVEKVSKSIAKEEPKEGPKPLDSSLMHEKEEEIKEERETIPEERQPPVSEMPEEEKPTVREVEDLIEELEEKKKETEEKEELPARHEIVEVDELIESVEEEKEEKPSLTAEQEARKEIAKARAEGIMEKPTDAEEVAAIERETAEEIRQIAEKEKPKEKRGFLSRVLEKTITEEDVTGIMRELELALLENDVAVEVAEKIGHDVKASLVNKSVRRGRIEEAIKGALRGAMLEVMQREKIDIDGMIREKEGPFTIVFLGFNGTGKTTSLCKLAAKFKKYKPMVAAGDTFRAASIEQLEEHSRRAGFRLVKHKYGADAAAVIFDAKKAAEADGSKLVLADTAGRSHSNVNLMDELKKIVRVCRPDMKILVLDALTGNDIYEQSRLFDDAVGVDAIILTKADVYDKGGAALSAAYTIKKPILYLGVGQEYDDLREFDPEEVADNLLK